MVWADNLSQRRIETIKARDKADKEAYIAAVNRQKEQQAEAGSIIARIWQTLVRWLKS